MRRYILLRVLYISVTDSTIYSSPNSPVSPSVLLATPGLPSRRRSPLRTALLPSPLPPRLPPPSLARSVLLLLSCLLVTMALMMRRSSPLPRSPRPPRPRVRVRARLSSPTTKKRRRKMRTRTMSRSRTRTLIRTLRRFKSLQPSSDDVQLGIALQQHDHRKQRILV